MPIKRFDEAFHASMISSYASWCGLAFKFRYIDGMKSAYRSVKMLNGTMLHRALEIIHQKNSFDLTDKELTQLIEKSLHWAEFEEERNKDEVVYWTDEKAEREVILTEGQMILRNYSQNQYNRHSKTILLEAKFLVKIGDKTIYNFEGRIDRLAEYEGILNLIDWKGGVSTPGDAAMLRNYQFPVYALACKEGEFIKESTGELIKLNRLPDSITHYQLRDHLEYQNPTPVKYLENRGRNLTASYRDWFNDIAKIYTPEEIRELTGNNRYNAKDKVYFPAGHERGPGMHSMQLSEHRIKIMKKCITYICAQIRMNMFAPNPDACPSCRFEDTCDIYLEGKDKPDSMSAAALKKFQKEHADII